MVISRRHVSDFFSLTEEEQRSIWEMVRATKQLLDRDYQPAGYNVGINVGLAAGQTVMHAHVHVIPRYDGDVDDPRGGVRCVIPGKQKY